MAELHVHLEGTAPPGARAGASPRATASRCPDGLDRRRRPLRLGRLPATSSTPTTAPPSVIRTAEDYRDIAREYLRASARRGRGLRRADRLARPRPPASGSPTPSTGGHRRRASTTPARDTASRRAMLIDPPCATSASSGGRGGRASARVATRTPTSSASGWPATRRASRRGASPAPSRSPHEAGLGCTVHAGEWAGAGAVRARARAAGHAHRPRRARDRGPGAGRASSPSAAPCWRSARPPTSRSASSRATPSTRCAALRRRRRAGDARLRRPAVLRRDDRRRVRGRGRTLRLLTDDRAGAITRTARSRRRSPSPVSSGSRWRVSGSPPRARVGPARGDDCVTVR